MAAEITMRFVLAAAAAASVFLPVPAMAQIQPALDLSAGYAFTAYGARAPLPITGRDLLEERFQGWTASIGGRIRPWLAIAGEMSGLYRSEGVAPGGDALTVRLHGFMAGPRIVLRPGADVAVFGQVLLGAHHYRLSFQGTAASTDFAIQPGGGVDMWATRRTALRFGADYRRVVFETRPLNQVRVHAGVVVAIRR